MMNRFLARLQPTALTVQPASLARRIVSSWLVAASACAGVSPWPVSAQDVRVQGRARGIEPPAWVLAQLQLDPNAFRFEHGWKEKVRRIARRRQALQTRGGPALSPADMARLAAAVTGTYEIPVIPALYADLGVPHTGAQLDARLFGEGSGTVSVSDLYTEMSGGAFTFNGTVMDWVALPNPTASYENGDQYGALFEFLRDALDLADAALDFGQFDNDGDDGIPNSGDDDGYVDTAAFLYATKAGSCGGSGIWPHRWAYRWARYLEGDGLIEAYATNDPSALGGVIRVDDYIVQSSLQCDGSSLMGAGTMAHELGHALDLPDLYDTDTEDGTASSGIGEWGLMGSGNHNEQTSPAHMSAWSKSRMGWLTVMDIATPQVGISLGSVQSTRGVLRVALPGTNESILLANRRAEGSDEHLNGQGLLIWHIDPDVVAAKQAANTVNADPDHKGVDLEEADGRDHLDRRVNRGDAGDPYPGSSGADNLTTLSYPSSDAYAGSYCTVGIRNIRESGSKVLLDVNPGERFVLWGDTDGNRGITPADRAEAYWYGLGYRNESQTYLSNGDVDGDGDVDIRDAFIIQSHLAGISAPGSRVDTSEFLDCTVDAVPQRLSVGERSRSRR